MRCRLTRLALKASGDTSRASAARAAKQIARAVVQAAPGIRCSSSPRQQMVVDRKPAPTNRPDHVSSIGSRPFPFASDSPSKSRNSASRLKAIVAPRDKRDAARHTLFCWLCPPCRGETKVGQLVELRGSNVRSALLQINTTDCDMGISKRLRQRGQATMSSIRTM